MGCDAMACDPHVPGFSYVYSLELILCSANCLLPSINRFILMDNSLYTQDSLATGLCTFQFDIQQYLPQSLITGKETHLSQISCNSFLFIVIIDIDFRE